MSDKHLAFVASWPPSETGAGAATRKTDTLYRDAGHGNTMPGYLEQEMVTQRSRSCRMKTLLSETELQSGVARMAAEINNDYGDQPLTIIGILTGSVVLIADLIRKLEMPLRVGVIGASSYRGATTTRGPLEVNAELMPDISGRNVLLVDDIFDTGHTLEQLTLRMSDFGPLSVKTAVLLRKQGRQEVDIEPDFVGFDIPDEFVVGYGLDYQDAYRNLPYVAALETAEIESCPP